MSVDIVTSVSRHHPATGEQLAKLLNSVEKQFPDLLRIFRETDNRVFYIRRSSDKGCITVAFLMDGLVAYLRLRVIFAGRKDGCDPEIHFSDGDGLIIKSLDGVLDLFRKEGYLLFSDFKRIQMERTEQELKETFGKVHLTWFNVIELRKTKLYDGMRIIVRTAPFQIHIWRVMIDNDGFTNFSIDSFHLVEFDASAFPILTSSTYINGLPTTIRNPFEKLFEETKTVTKTIIIGLCDEPLFPFGLFFTKEVDCSP
jgi:hypothetical protein